jgi:hypothetical protein
MEKNIHIDLLLFHFVPEKMLQAYILYAQRMLGFCKWKAYG